MKLHISFVISVLILVFFVVINGCSSEKPDIGKDEAVKIAKREAIRRGCVGMELQDARVEKGNWMITLHNVPAIPGGHMLFEISQKGKILYILEGR